MSSDERQSAPHWLERGQVAAYALAVVLGAALGLAWPGAGDVLAAGLWPALGLLLFATFLHVPIARLGEALRERRFLGALLAGNFALVPVAVWGLSHLVPDDPAIRLAFFLVLLAPCTDWFNTFAHLGRGDARLSLAATPVLLAAQLLFLPVFLVVFLGPEAAGGMRAEPFVRALFAIVLLPLGLALAVQGLARRRKDLAHVLRRAERAPIALLAVVLFVIAASEITAVAGAGADLARVALVFVAYLAIAPLLALAASRALGVGGAAERTIVFSLGSRNSFVILPLALAWPGAGPVAVAVVVTQSLVELVGMIAYVALVPRWIARRRS